MKKKKVLVSGCFDLLHGGNIAFFKAASAYGKLYVSINRDSNILVLTGKKPYISEQERLYIVSSIKYVEDAFLPSGTGKLDFEPDMKKLKPDIFIVNNEDHSADKEALCKKEGVEYTVLERIHEPGLPGLSGSETKRELRFPYRLCLAGGWIDQPWVSKINPGSVIVAQIWPTMDFIDRSGLATSSRKVAIKLWGDRYPDGDHETNARLLFGAENPPGRIYVSGSQDHIGLLYPGINRLWYRGGYWPERIESTIDKETCEWLSEVIHLVPVTPRPMGYDPLKLMNLEKSTIRELGEAGDSCWESIIKKDVDGLGKSMTTTLRAWKKILPLTVPDPIMNELETKYFQNYAGAITSGSGGGYIMVASEKPVEGAVKIKVRY